MPINRFFVADGLDVNQDAIISGQEFHHISHVIRTREGEDVELVNGKGVLASATLLKKTRHEAFFKIHEIQTFNPPQLNLALHQAIPKINKLEVIIEKCTELGATEFILFPSEKSEKSLSQSNIERLNYILISAMKQSGRFHLPKMIIGPSINLMDHTQNINFFGDIRETAIPLIKQLDQKFINQKLNFFIGPESGFTSSEIKFFDDKNFFKTKLCNHILRTETASITAISLIQQFFL